MYRFFKNAEILRYTIDLGVKEGKMKELCSKCLQTEKEIILQTSGDILLQI